MSKVTKAPKFTAVDLENHLFDLATSVMNKTSNPTKTNSSVNAIRGILQIQSLKIRAAALGLKGGDKSKFILLGN